MSNTEESETTEQESGPRKAVPASVIEDAHQFGLWDKQHGWRLGLLVARNVRKGTGQGARRPRNDRYDVDKVSASTFARMAGTSAPRVLRYLAAWEYAADRGHVPHAEDLRPGQELDLDVDKLPLWAHLLWGLPPNAGKRKRRKELPTLSWEQKFALSRRDLFTINKQLRELMERGASGGEWTDSPGEFDARLTVSDWLRRLEKRVAEAISIFERPYPVDLPDDDVESDLATGNGPAEDRRRDLWTETDSEVSEEAENRPAA